MNRLMPNLKRYKPYASAAVRFPFGLKPADAVQAASALAINAAALATHDRDFSRVRSLRIIA